MTLLEISTDALINRIAIMVVFILLVAIFIYVSGLNKKFSFKRNIVEEYINTTARLKSIEYAPNGIVTTTADGTIVSWNSGAKSIFGYSEAEIIGKNLLTIIPEEYRDRHIRGMEMAKMKGFSNIIGKPVIAEGLRKDRTKFPLETTISQWKEGNVIYYTGIMKDITEQNMQQEFNEMLLRIYIEAEELSNYGAWKWNVITDRVTVTEGFRKIWELEADKYDYYSLMSRVYYEDRKALDKIIQDAVTNKTDYKAEYRIVGRNGKIKKVYTIVKLIVNNGIVEKLIGVLYEISNDDKRPT